MALVPRLADPARRAASARRCERDGGRGDRARARATRAAPWSASTRARRCSRRDASASRTKGLSDRIELREARAESLPFADGEFDALTFTYLLRYVDDVPATLRELARVVRPGGDCGHARVRAPARRLAPALGALRASRAARRRGRSSRPAGAASGASSARASAASGATGRSRASSRRGTTRASPRSRLGRLSLGGGIVVWGRRA